MVTIRGWTLSREPDCAHYRRVARLAAVIEAVAGLAAVIEAVARLAAVIEATNSSFLEPIGMWTLSLKCDGGHYRTVGTIAGDLTLSLGTDTIAKIQR